MTRRPVPRTSHDRHGQADRWLTPATNVCFAVQALRGDLSSPFSEKVCVDTPAAQSTVTPSPSGQPSSPGPSRVPPSLEERALRVVVTGVVAPAVQGGRTLDVGLG